MSWERLQSSSAQISFNVSSNCFGNLKAVKHSGEVCCNVLKYFSLWSCQMESARSESVSLLVSSALRSNPSGSQAGLGSSNIIV
jgi:hypothetical protein